MVKIPRATRVIGAKKPTGDSARSISYLSKKLSGCLKIWLEMICEVNNIPTAANISPSKSKRQYHAGSTWPYLAIMSNLWNSVSATIQLSLNICWFFSNLLLDLYLVHHDSVPAFSSYFFLSATNFYPCSINVLIF